MNIAPCAKLTIAQHAEDDTQTERKQREEPAVHQPVEELRQQVVGRERACASSGRKEAGINCRPPFRYPRATRLGRYQSFLHVDWDSGRKARTGGIV